MAIRPEVELLYIALSNTCFELLEIRGRDHSNWNSSSISTHNEPLVNTASSDDDVMDNDNDGENDPSSEADMETSPLAEGASETESDDGSKSLDELDEDIMDGNKTPADFRLREILFYDDKISIFKARHGRL